MPTTTRTKPAGAKAKTTTTTPETMGRFLVIGNGGKTLVDESVGHARLLKMVDGLPKMVRAWKTGRYRVTIECEIMGPTGPKKGPIKKAAPLH